MTTQRRIGTALFVSGLFTVAVTMAVLNMRTPAPERCISGDTRATTPCAPGPNAVLSETCTNGAWVASSCNANLPTSELCYPTIPPVDLTDAIIVSTGTYISWNQVLTGLNGGTKHQILLQPGDYRPWGNLLIGSNIRSGTTAQPIIIRYYGTSDTLPPWQRVNVSTEANLQGFLIGSDGGSPKVHDWIFEGLTVDSPDVNATGSISIQSGNYLTIDQNLVQNDPHPTGMKIRDSDGVCIQRNVLRTSTTPANDPPAIQVKPLGRDITALAIVQNEIYDWTDAIQSTAEPACINSRGHECTVGMTVLDNDLYTTSAKYVTDPISGNIWGCTENAVDLKAYPQATYIIKRNRMWGFRETPSLAYYSLCGSGFASGSAGDAIVVHINASETLFAENIIGDSISAIRASSNATGRQVVFRDNYVYTIPPAGAAKTYYNGAATVVEEPTLISANVFFNTPLLCPADGTPYPTWPPAGWLPGPPVVLGNTRIGTTVVGSCPSLQDAPSKAKIDFKYQRKRLTGTETITVTGGYQ